MMMMMIRIVNQILDNLIHPVLRNYWTLNSNARIACDFKPRTAMGKKSFKVRAAEVFNSQPEEGQPHREHQMQI